MIEWLCPSSLIFKFINLSVFQALGTQTWLWHNSFTDRAHYSTGETNKPGDQPPQFLGLRDFSGHETLSFKTGTVLGKLGREEKVTFLLVQRKPQKKGTLEEALECILPDGEGHLRKRVGDTKAFRNIHFCLTRVEDKWIHRCTWLPVAGVGAGGRARRWKLQDWKTSSKSWHGAWFCQQVSLLPLWFKSNG